MILYVSDGRLGNQLFQLAFIESIAQKNEKIIFVCLKNELDMVFIRSNRLFILETRKIFWYFLKAITSAKLLDYLCVVLGLGYAAQKIKNGVFLDSYKHRRGIFPVTVVKPGFSQSEMFFNVEKLNISILKKHVKKAEVLFDQWRKYDVVVFVHVRRGDYQKEMFLGKEGICLPLSYYKKVITDVQQGYANPFFVFVSDDFDFVKRSFGFVENKYISNSSMGVDLALMSLCDFGVCANSSFSWCGAWLCKRRGKVYFPKYWYGWRVSFDSHPGIIPKWGFAFQV